jgi:hypothetical protein
MVDFLNSMSWIAGMPEEQRNETLAEITALVDSGETPAEIDVHVIVGLAKLL